MSGAAWAAVADAALQVGAQWMNSSAQHKANRTNIQLQREQQKWEQMMSNTAIQRRANDIEQAGGNRALAFVNGSEATTPTVTPARVEAPRYAFDSAKVIQAMTAQAQIDNLKANTAKQSADARATNIDTDIREAGADYEVKYGVLSKEQMYRRIEKEIDNLDVRRDLTAAQTAKIESTMEQLASILTQQVREGQLNLSALENVAKIGGIEGKTLAPLLKALVDIYLSSRK